MFDGSRTLGPADVLVEGGRIAAVAQCGSGGSSPASIVDGRGKTLLPGLIDAHVHTPAAPEWAERALRQSLAAGVTTVLCMGTHPDVAAALRARAALTSDLADLRSSGWCATVPGGHPTEWAQGYYPTLSGADDAALFVQARADEGMDYIKIVIEDWVGRPCPKMSLELSRALATQAHARGMLAIAHVTKYDHAVQALESGVDGFAHQFFDADLTLPFARTLAREGIFVVMTLNITFVAQGALLAEDSRLGPYMEPTYRERLATERDVFTEENGLINLRAVSCLREAGVQILAGTDSPGLGAIGPSLHHELGLLVRGGLTPTEALAAATSVPARAFGLDDRGSIREGSRADLLLVDGDPTADIDATKSISRIWRGGTEFDREGFRAGLG